MAKQLSIVIKAEQATEDGQPIQAESPKLNTFQYIAQGIYANRLIEASVSTIKQCFNYQASMYGSTTGDYITQSKIDNTFELVNNILSVGSSIAGGFAMGGPAGAAVGAVISVGSIAVNSALGNNTYQLNIRKENAAASFNSAQIGSILVNGNR